MCRGLVTRREDARAFERNIYAGVLPGKLRRVLYRRDPEFLAAPVGRIALDLHLARKSAVDRVEAQQMRIGLDRTKIVDGHDVDILTTGFIDGAHDVAADAAKSVDGNSDGHARFPQGIRCWKSRFI